MSENGRSRRNGGFDEDSAQIHEHQKKQDEEAQLEKIKGIDRNQPNTYEDFATVVVAEKALADAMDVLEKAEAALENAGAEVGPAKDAYNKAEREYLMALSDYAALESVVTAETETVSDNQPKTGDTSDVAAAAAMMGAALLTAAAISRRKTTFDDID